jgi:C1A family cysteine protease
MAKTKAKARVSKKDPAVSAKPQHGYGWTADLPDHRDFMYSAPAPVTAAFPPHVDLTSLCPPVYNQGQLGSCTANAIGAAIQFEQMKQKEKSFTPSRLFIYYNERTIEHTVNSDSGAQIRDGIKSVASIGAPPEVPDWPYVISKFEQKPPAKAFKDAGEGLAVQYMRLAQDVNQMKGCLASGYPFVFGFTVYQSFETPQVAKTGVVPMPAASEKVLGGHAVMCVGYDDPSDRLIVRNSWGTSWGMAGYFTMPYAYVTNSNLSDDFWTIRLVH